MKKITSAVLGVINKSKQLLFADPHDVAHDINHHYRVWEHCINIIVEENLFNKVNLPALYIAAWWHDYKRGSKGHRELIKELKDNKFPFSEIEYIIGIMNSHSFGDAAQDTLEAKILYDADKIEYIAPARWEMINLVIKFEPFPRERILGYCRGINERLPVVQKKLYFEYSRKFFANNLRNLVGYLKSELADPVIGKNLDLELLERLKEKS